HGVKLLTYIPPQTSSDIEKERVFKSLLPEAESFSGSLSPKDAPPYYAAYDSEGNPIAIIFFTEEVSPEVEGYAGKIPACVACDLELRVKAVRFLPNKETPELVDEMFEEKFARQFVGKTPSDRFEAGVDVKGISGATVTTDAICRSIKLSLERIASAYSSTPFPKTSRPFLSWYSLLRSGVVVLFFCGAILFCISRLQRLRLILLALSVAVLGFCFKGLFLSTRSVTTLFVDGRVSQSPELWVLAGGALVTSLLWGRLYCGYVCPFGGLSELLFRILPIKLKISPKVIGFLRWVKYGIFVSLILLLAAGSSLYFAEKLEPFAPIFIGAPATSLILALITLLLSASFYRFYCRFLCPIGAVMELLSSARILSPNTPITCDSCGLCRKECPSEALHFKGKKLYQEAAFCFNCVDCDVVRRRKGCVQSR
ncbi:MAG: 4Fe-4S binding protein, partial [Planctomycetota bacterium]|nr:4Fe-4S binding protein [Planctomycetota bacterium]